MQPPAWAYTLVPPVPELPEDLTVFPAPVRTMGYVPIGARGPRRKPVLTGAAADARLWWRAGKSFLVIAARLNQRYPRPDGPWTYARVRRFLAGCD